MDRQKDNLVWLPVYLPQLWHRGPGKERQRHLFVMEWASLLLIHRLVCLFHLVSSTQNQTEKRYKENFLQNCVSDHLYYLIPFQCLLFYLYHVWYEMKTLNLKQDVFVKHECPQNGHFLRNVIYIFDLCRWPWPWYQQMHIDDICLHTNMSLVRKLV